MCRLCQGNIDNQVFCLGCYTSRAIDPLLQNNALTIPKMCLVLKDKYNFDGTNDLDIIEVEDVFWSIGYVEKYHQQEHNVCFSKTLPSLFLKINCGIMSLILTSRPNEPSSLILPFALNMSRVFSCCLDLL